MNPSDPKPARPSATGDPEAPTVSSDGTEASGRSAGSRPNAGTTPRLAAERPGTAIDGYTLGGLLGEGGFGAVYRAEQQEPVRRTVALKVIKAGMDTGEVIARFEGERQALALMDHPNIARVLDAGATASGRPYFVMELIPGPPVTEYCDRRRLGTRERLELFAEICRGVQHAHQKGVIHRDLKPSNVLVVEHDGRPVAKIIDFGVAKAIKGDPTSGGYTMEGQLMGTPLYMSPEQADGGEARVDTRADIYSLGVLLCELLTGRTPFTQDRLKAGGYDGMRRILMEETPPKPSTLVGTLNAEEARRLADFRATAPERLGRAIRGDLDWIVMRALEKDPDRRYPTAAALAEDIRRHLEGLPVEASPPSASYRVSRFVRRHRVAVFAAGAVTVSILAGSAISLWQAVRATRMQHALQSALDDSQQAIARMRRETTAAPGLGGQLDALERIETELTSLDRKLEAHRARNGLLAAQIEQARQKRKALEIPNGSPEGTTPASSPAPLQTRSGLASKPIGRENDRAIFDTAIAKLEADQTALAREIAEIEKARERLLADKRAVLEALRTGK